MSFGKKEISYEEKALRILEDELIRLHKMGEYAGQGQTAAMVEIARINQALAIIATGTVESRIKALEDAMTDLYLTTERKDKA